MYDSRGPRNEQNETRGMPLVLPESERLNERFFELKNIFQTMTVTKRDRESDLYRQMRSVLDRGTTVAVAIEPAVDGVVSYGAGSPLGPEDPDARASWIDEMYLGERAKESFVGALVGGLIPIWTDHQHSFMQLDTVALFSPNKWDQRAVLHGGVYRAMNIRHDFDDDRRAATENAVLRVKDEDWWPIRDSLVAERKRRFQSELPVAVRMATGIGCPRHKVPDAPKLPARDARHEDFSNHIWEGANLEWATGSIESWPKQDGECVFLGTAVLQLGRARFDDQWVDDIPMRGRPPKETPQKPLNRSGLWLEGYLNEREWAQAMTSQALWPMFDAVVDELILAAQGGQLRCFSREADHRELVPIGAKSWRLPESIAVFKRCSIDPNKPFAGVPSFKSGHKVFVHSEDLQALVEGRPTKSDEEAEDRVQVTKPPVPMSDLKDWIILANREGKSKRWIEKNAASAFRDHEPPGRPTLRKLDVEVRKELGLPARTVGKPKSQCAN